MKLRAFVYLFFAQSINMLANGQSAYSKKNIGWQMASNPLQTRWSKEVSPENTLMEYPRPQMERSSWKNLNGLWNYSITDSAVKWPTKYEGQILVPYAIESALSGVKRVLNPNQRLWYSRRIKLDKSDSKRYLLHFGAVDNEANVYINNKHVGVHKGGYNSFAIDITDALTHNFNEVTVSVLDPTDNGNNPKGKQVLHPEGIMYTASSGIWQTVWLEEVPKVYISAINMLPNIDSQLLKLNVTVNTNEKDYSIRVKINNEKESSHSNGSTLTIPVHNEHLWTPDDPYLYNMVIQLVKKDKIIDEVKSYFGMRKIEVKQAADKQYRIFLNNKELFNLGVLDQGFWPEGLHTAPNDAALKWDIEVIKKMGFNTIRKHIKVEPARWYYHCDKLGMLVWQDMVYPANLSMDAKKQFEKESSETVSQLYNYPSIVCWVLFNEGWNRYDQTRLTTWMKQLDSSRLINGHSGENYDRDAPKESSRKWVGSDIVDIHDYPGPSIAPILPGKARVLGEWGGVRVATPGHQWNGNISWGYVETTPEEFSRKYEFMIKHLSVYKEEGLSASIYTQPFDVEIEENGLITYDREVFKIPVEKIRSINDLILHPPK